MSLLDNSSRDMRTEPLRIKDRNNTLPCPIYLKEYNDNVITVAYVITAVDHLKQDKTDEDEGLMSNIIQGNHSLYVLLTYF